VLELLLSLGLVGPPVLPDAPAADPPPTEDGTPSEPTPADRVAAAVDLSWSAPASCPGAETVRRGIAALLASTTEVSAASEVTVTATVTQGPTQFRLALEVVTPSGKTTKTTGGAQCEVLADATALIAAIAIDPSAVLEATEPPPEEPEPDKPEPEQPKPEPAATEGEGEGEGEGRDDGTGERPAPEEGPRVAPKLPPRVTLVRFAFRASGGLDVATLPGVSGGIGVLGAVLGANWRAELVGRVLFPRNGFVVDDTGARIGLFTLGARGCWVPTVGPVEMPLCGGGEAGAFRGDPIGDRIANGVTVTEPYVAAIGSYEVGWAPRPFFALVGRAELVVPLLRPSFFIGDELAHQIPPASGRLFFGIEARFP